MFTGIVEEIGRVRSLESPPDGTGIARLSIGATKVIDHLFKPGDSISVNGACLTVVDVHADSFSVELTPETLRRTDLGSLEPGSGVNLERPLPADGRLGGHIVQGHVDATGKLVYLKPEGEATMMGVRPPRRLMPYIVAKGFIAVDGISLTVVKKMATIFSVSVIPYTLENTVLKYRRPGDPVNLEVDIVAKYVQSLVAAR